MSDVRSMSDLPTTSDPLGVTGFSADVFTISELLHEEDGVVEDEQTYKIQYIIHARASRDDKGKPDWRYRIRWEGYSPNDDTYEPRECIEGEHGGKSYLNRFWKSTGLSRDVRHHAFETIVEPSQEWIDEQLRADIPASEGENDSDDDETLDEIMRAQREAKIRERKQQEESAAAQEIIARLHSSSSPVKSTVTPEKSTVTPQKRRSLVDEVEILSSDGVWTGLAKRRKVSPLVTPLFPCLTLFCTDFYSAACAIHLPACDCQAQGSATEEYYWRF
ncbi:hypothetical protein CALVIDRAFT_58192 [Calocera viscosa TUFC12733]|uniref:Chromo domain-containing protein n=1 Tax=Calocera viscosa (strain TUFC12733) TaxID=1330018 RepID=A0A167NH82_CALVF|nr:hypothetical protein CALVIDRAFT_58192 [Calocera viscosa TUFC12733]